MQTCITIFPGNFLRVCELEAALKSSMVYIEFSMQSGVKNITSKHLQPPGSPTLKQHIQTIWYTFHQRME